MQQQPDHVNHRLLLLLPIFIALVVIAWAPVATALEKFESRNYTIYTDMPADEVRPLAQHMDAVFNAYKKRFVSSRVGRDRGRGKESLYLFGERSAYISQMASLGIGAEDSGGMFFARDGKAGLATWVYDKPMKETIQTLQHEGFHQFAFRFIGPELPLWVNEGLAVYFEQAQLVKGKLKIGVAEPHRVKAIQAGVKDRKQFPIDEIITITSDQWFANMSDPQRGAMQYVQSWSLCHFLIHGKKGRLQKPFNQYLKLIGAGHRSAKAFATAFGTDNYKALETAWLEYVNEELEPDPYSAMTAKLDFLANALRWLKNNDAEIPSTLNGLKQRLQASGYSITYNGGYTVNASDEANYVYPDSKGKDIPFDYEFDTKTGMPVITAKRIKPTATISWSEVGDRLVYEIKYR